MATTKSSKPSASAPQIPDVERKRRRPAAPVEVKDPLRPHTHTAQRLHVYDGPIPSYVAAMDAYAIAAGLAVRHLTGVAFGGDLQLFYAGTKEQIERCELVCEPKTICWPRTNKATMFRPVLAWPGHHRCHGNVYLLSRDLFAIGIKVDLPLAVSRPAPGVECFDFTEPGSRWGGLAYCGSKEALLSAGIGDADMFPDDPEVEGMEIKDEAESYGYMPTLEESIRLHNGTWAYFKYPQKIREVQERQQTSREEHLSPYSTPDEWLESKEDCICSVARTVCSEKYCSLDTKDGLRYTVNPADLATIQNDIEVLAQRLRSLPVKVQSLKGKSKPQDRLRAAAAESDGKFQTFMQAIVKR
jgi:hypothetical protein